MNFINKINLFIALYLDAFQCARRPVTWLPFFLYGVLQFVVLIILLNYVNPLIYPVLSPIVSLTGGDNEQMFRHYPGLFLLLPYVYQWLRIAVGVLFEGLVTGLTIILVLRILSPNHLGKLNLSSAYKYWPRLLIVWTIITGILVGVNQFVPPLFSEQLAYSPRRQMAFEIFMRLLTVGLYSVFIYALPAIILCKNNLLSAFGLSLSLFVKYPIFSFFLAFVPFLLTLPVSYATGNADVIIEKFSPELIFYVLCGGIVISMVVNYFLTVTVTKFILDRVE